MVRFAPCLLSVAAAAAALPVLAAPALAAEATEPAAAPAASAAATAEPTGAPTGAPPAAEPTAAPAEPAAASSEVPAAEPTAASTTSADAAPSPAETVTVGPEPTEEPSPQAADRPAWVSAHSTDRITYGQSARLSGYVAYDGRSAEGAPVELWAQTPSARWLVALLTADAGGEWTYLARPSGTTRFTATSDGVSGSTTVAVVPRLAVSGPSTATAVPASNRFTGTVAPARSGVVVGVSLRKSTGTVLLARGTTDSAGRYSVPVRLPASGTYVVATRATADLLSASTTRTLRVSGGTAPATTSSSVRRGSTTQPRLGDGVGEIKGMSVALDRGARKARVDVAFHRAPYGFHDVTVSLGVLRGSTCDTYGSGRPNVYFQPWNSGTGTAGYGTSTRGTSSARTGGRVYSLTGSALANPYTCAHVEVWWAHEWKHHWDDECDCPTRIWTTDEAVVRLG